jgi:hypothetical protein
MVFGHAIAEGISGQFEQATRFRHVTGGFAERFLQHPFLHFLKGEAKRQEGRFQIDAGAVCDWSGLD